MAGKIDQSVSVKKVDLDKYLAALEMFVDKSKVRILREKLDQFGVKGYVTVSRNVKDVAAPPVLPVSSLSSSNILKWAVQILLNMAKSAKMSETIVSYKRAGVEESLRFYMTGKIYRGLKDWKSAGSISSDLATYFIGGLFGVIPEESFNDKGEMVVKEGTFQSALSTSKGCWEEGSSEGCDMAKLEMLASKEKVKKVWGIAERMLKWAVENDHWYNHIKPDEIRVIMKKFDHLEKTNPQNVEEARYYVREAKQMLVDLTAAHTGVKAAEKLWLTELNSECKDSPAACEGTLTECVLPSGIKITRRIGPDCPPHEHSGAGGR